MRKKQLRKPDVPRATATATDAAASTAPPPGTGGPEGSTAAGTPSGTGANGATRADSGTGSPSGTSPDSPNSPTGIDADGVTGVRAHGAAGVETGVTEDATEDAAEGSAGADDAVEPGPPSAPASAVATGNASAPAPSPPPRKKARVRNRLLASVVLCAVAVLAAGTPTVASASRDATDAQELVDLARLNQQAIALSHSLADERDGMVEYIAAGRTSRGGAGVSEAQRARVDRQIRELGDGTAQAPPAHVGKALKGMPKTRQRAITGRGSALDSYDAYTRVIQALRGITRSVAGGLPARAQDATAAALPDLARAIDQASATRGLLRGAMAGTGTQRELTTQAQQARVREQSALADFEESAGAKARDSYSTTVNGTDVNAAERYLDKLTARPYLTPTARAVSGERLNSSLSARIAHMRGVQSSFAVDEIKRLEQLRDDDVTALQIRAALLGVCLLLAVGISVTTARSLARPLSVLKRGSLRLAEDPAHAEPVAFHGRNDEFADVVRALNALRATAADLQRRAAHAESEQDQLAVSKAELTERHQLLQDDFGGLRDELATVREELAAAGDAAHGNFVQLALRTLGLVERQLAVIEGLEEKETDPERLGTLFKLDHLATRMRRHGENLLLLADSEQSGGHQQAPTPLLDVLRAAVSEIERYERVELGSLPPHSQVSGFASDDLSHLVAELLDNAAAFSPPDSVVRLSGWMLESGEVMLSVQDDGIGVSDSQLTALNSRLSEPGAQQAPFTADGGALAPDEAVQGAGLGLHVVAKLAARHGLRVQLRKQEQGGTAAVVIVPRALLPDRPAPAASAPAGGAGHAEAAELPGSVAEANSNALPVRRTARRAVPAEAARFPETLEAPEAPADSYPEPETGPEPAPGPGPEADGGPEAEPGTTEPHTTGPGTSAPATPAPGDEHTRAGDAGDARNAENAEEPAPAHSPADAAQSDQHPQEVRPEGGPDAAVTDKGLPKRTPRITAQQTPAPRQRKGGANAEELRRRLGGFQQGAREGFRAAEAQVAAEEDADEQTGAQVDGGTAEEAHK